MKIALTPAFLAICLLASTAVDASPIPSQLGTNLVPRHASPSPNDMFSLFVRDSKLYKSTLQDGHGDDGLQKRSEDEARIFRDELKKLDLAVAESAGSVKLKVSDPKTERLEAMESLVTMLESTKDSVLSRLEKAAVVDDTGNWDTVNLIGDKYPENAAVLKQHAAQVDKRIVKMRDDIRALKKALESEIRRKEIQRMKEEAEGQ
ncbi:hypothetical protein H0H93_001502 [Arthromyces matolae]|nr:hypothetical protein H0H93_001502 [Arthromyces matolae]